MEAEHSTTAIKRRNLNGQIGLQARGMMRCFFGFWGSSLFMFPADIFSLTGSRSQVV